VKGSREAISSPQAPAAIGPYSPAIRAGEFLFCSGQIGIDPSTGELVPGGVAAECRQAMANLEAILRAAGLGWSDVVRTTIYLVRLEDFPVVNGIYSGFLREPYPARSTVGVAALPRGASIEIDLVARAG
jgi:2-iminobutanoate/2-iminopropanoate deaminase